MTATNFAKALENESLVNLSTFSEVDFEAFNNAAFLTGDVYASLDIWEERERVGENAIDVFNFYATNLQENDVKMYTKQYSNMLFVYSEILDMWVLCTTQCGTPWRGIQVNKYTEDEIKENEERIEEIKQKLE